MTLAVFVVFMRVAVWQTFGEASLNRMIKQVSANLIESKAGDVVTCVRA